MSVDLTSDFQEILISEEQEIQASEAENKAEPISSPVEPKKGRGRPKKQKTEETTVKKPEKVNLQDIKANYKKVEKETVQNAAQPVQVTEQAASLISGHVLLLICDFAMPSLVVYLLKKKKPDLKSENLQLTAKEWEKLEPLADKAATAIFGNLDPVTGFFISVGAIYLGKGMMK